MKAKTIFVCSECGFETSNWGGKCPSCGMWNTLKEYKAESSKKSSKSGYRPIVSGSIDDRRAKPLSELSTNDELRFFTGISELDRVLGGGAVEGSLILVGGAPGIGKSTMLLQMCGNLAEKVLYVSAEESERQIKLRSERLKVNSEKIFVYAEVDIDKILDSISDISPDVVIIDSIQTIYDSTLDSSTGSVTQVRECTMKLMRFCKSSGITVFIVGHINKEGSLSGPKVLEHMVDCVLYFEGERSTSFRILRAEKNRFGSTNEIGVFEMIDTGLKCIDNPSETLLAGRPENSPGTCVTCVVEGSRPILAEIQALVSPTNYNPSRRSNGIDYNRLSMLIAVLDKRGGLSVSGCDTYINVIGGLNLDEPAADLATVLALASAYREKPLGSDLAAIGEVGLSGEVRSVSNINNRLLEISRLGFKRCVIPFHIKGDIRTPKGVTLIPVKNIRQAITAVIS